MTPENLRAREQRQHRGDQRVRSPTQRALLITATYAGKQRRPPCCSGLTCVAESDESRREQPRGDADRDLLAPACDAAAPSRKRWRRAGV